MADDPNHTRASDRYQQPKDELLDEMIRVGDYEFELYEDHVLIVGREEEVIEIRPTTVREAHQLSRALRRCSIRVTTFADKLPPESDAT